jgi:mono/diheme cytochrome c family protein
MRKLLREPFWQAVAVLIAAYLLFEFGIAYLPPLLGAASAPVPDSVLLQYMATVLVALLLYVSADEARWRAFKAPLRAVLVDPDKRRLRSVLLVTVPLAIGLFVFAQVRPTVAAPASLRSIHPAPPSTITFRGRTIALAGLENPLRQGGVSEAELATGQRVYYENCMPCHGDRMEGDGHFAHGFNPAPINFGDPGTIAQLTESFVFWRIAKGGPGLPVEGAPWSSAMPAWEDILTEEETWAVILYLYHQTGRTPRTWEVAGEGEH